MLEPNDSKRLAELCGQLNEHIKQIETRFDIEIRNRANQFQLQGTQDNIIQCKQLLSDLYQQTSGKELLNAEKVHLAIQNRKAQIQDPSQTMSDTENKQNNLAENTNTEAKDDSIIIETPRKSIASRGLNQQHYLKGIEKFDISFGIGPAGTGKTYLAVACAVAALKQEQVGRIVLVRPAVEAGEKLGFLPGDLNDKVNPYLRPLYDALYEMLGFETVEKFVEKNIIEIAPLAYMRGRTLNNAFIILDESQNTTREQMKMFLTRIGFGSKAVITGDVTQIDLPKGTESGLIHATQVLENIKEISFSHFTSKDVVRHKLVQRIVEAYSAHESKQTLEKLPSRSKSRT